MPPMSISARPDGRAADQARQGHDQHRGAELATLKAAGYDGYLALEYTHQDYMDSLFDDILTETIQLRDLMRAWEAA